MRRSDILFAFVSSVALLSAVVELVASPGVWTGLGVSFWLMMGLSALGWLRARNPDERARVTKWLGAVWAGQGAVLVTFGIIRLAQGTENRRRAIEVIAVGALTVIFFGGLPVAARRISAARQLPGHLLARLATLPKDKQGRQHVILVLGAGQHVDGLVLDGALLEPRKLQPAMVHDVLPANAGLRPPP